MAQDCVFCKIARAEIPATFLHRDDRCFVIRDIRPKAPTHLLVIPLDHEADVAATKTEGTALLGHLLSIAAEMAKREGIARSGYQLVINQGPNSGQEVAHLHLHVLGGQRLEGMA